MKQVFLHIGTQKTGSSSLQFFLSENKERLAELGYLYPSKVRAHHYLAYSLLGDPREQYQSTNWEDTITEIENSELNKIVISSEFFVQTIKMEFIQAIAEKLKKYNTKVIIYLKRQDKKVESSFNQQIKTGVYTGTVDFFLQESNPPNYLKILDSWGQVFGRDNILVRPLEKEQIPDIYKDFLDCIEIHHMDGFNRTEDRNVKPSINQIIAINFINQKTAKRLGLGNRGFFNLNNQSKRFLPRNYHLSFLKYTKNWQGSTKYNLIPYERAVEILKECEEQNAQIAKLYLKREDGRLFYEPLEQYKHQNLNINNLSKEQLIDICSFIIRKRSKMENMTNLQQEEDDDNISNDIFESSEDLE